ncbi:MAG: GldG family protein [Myxococcota bacterium]|nr:GldG family protein [Myxococcota bacterium]
MTLARFRPESGQLLQLAGVLAAVVLAGIVNVLGARHFTRWDWTRDRRWSLSPATLETLRSLQRPVEVWAIVGDGDPLASTLNPLLASYRAQSSQIDVHWIDPDRDTVQLTALQRRFGLEAGRAEDGRVATDAVLIVATADKHWFLTPQDLFEASDDVRVKPREERAMTTAIRSVLGGEKARLCFTTGHGELSLEPGRDERQWLGAWRDLLDKNNYELVTVDATSPGVDAPFAACSVVVIAGARAAFAPNEASRLRSWLLAGGALLAAVGPVDAATSTGMAPAGLDDVLAPFGIALTDDLVHDLDPGVAVVETHGEGFFVTARPHAVTASLVAGGSEAHPPRIAMFYTRSLRHVSPPGASTAADLLVTTASAFAKESIAGAATWADLPPREPTDATGPFVVAMASERPRAATTDPHGPRVVVVGSRFVLSEDNWRQPRPLHGTAFFVDSALSWLAARPQVVDVPDRAEIAAGMRVSEAGRDEVRRYVLGLMPLAALLLGVAVWAWRKSSEDRPYVSPGIAKGPPS